jgi:hypothetical protein
MVALPTESDATQSPYPGWQNVAYSRNVMRNKTRNFQQTEAPPFMAAQKMVDKMKQTV